MRDGAFHTLIEILAPLACIDCGHGRTTPAAPLCATCAGGLGWWRRLDGCPRCGATPQSDGLKDLESGSEPRPRACPGCYSEGSALHSCHALLRYEGRARDWIPGFKHRSTAFGPPLACRLAVEFFADELARRVSARGLLRPDLILPVPLHSQRRRRRGFNQSDAIARRIASALRLPFSNNELLRRRPTPPQARLDLQQRRANLRGAFLAKRPMNAHARIWLVDDVLTTGATLDAAANACLDAGVEEVHALTLAATPPRSQCSWPR